MEWILCILILIIVPLPAVILWILCIPDKKIYKVVWTYDSFCPPTTELVKAKDMYNAWNKIRKRHALPITLIEVSEFV